MFSRQSKQRSNSASSRVGLRGAIIEPQQVPGRLRQPFLIQIPQHFELRQLPTREGE
jgi:hypothetical protein